MRVLGLSAFHLDSAAALVIDGRVAAAAREGWHRRRAHDGGFPLRAARECLRRGDLRVEDLDAVVYERKPLLEFERLLVSHLRAFPSSALSFARSMFPMLGDRMWVRSRIASELGVPYQRVHFVEHQRALAAAAWYQSPFEEAALLTVDRDGEWATTTLGQAGPGRLEILAELHFPHSLARVAAAVTQLMGLEPVRDAGRVEGLAAGGEPRFLAELEALVPVAARGSHGVDAAAFRFAYDDVQLFGPGLVQALGPARQPGAPPGAREADLAASLQGLLERRVLELAGELARLTGVRSLCFTGSLAMNRRLVARIAEDGPFDSLFVPPSPDEAGAALGAALLVAGELQPASRLAEPVRFPGPELALDVEGAMDSDAMAGGPSRLAGAEAPRVPLGRILARGGCIAWVRGALELGPQSLGHRSVLGAATGADARRRLLAAVGRDELGREARLLVPSERAAEYLELTPAGVLALASGWLAPRARRLLSGCAPSAVAADGRVPARSVAADSDPELHALLVEHGQRTGAPLLLEVTFRSAGGAAVRTEAEALEAFQRSSLDALCVADRLYGEVETELEADVETLVEGDA